MFAWRAWQRLGWVDSRLLTGRVPRKFFYNVLITGVAGPSTGSAAAPPTGT
jgi:hypothetical protein